MPIRREDGSPCIPVEVMIRPRLLVAALPAALAVGLLPLTAAGAAGPSGPSGPVQGTVERLAVDGAGGNPRAQQTLTYLDTPSGRVKVPTSQLRNVRSGTRVQVQLGAAQTSGNAEESGRRVAAATVLSAPPAPATSSPPPPGFAAAAADLHQVVAVPVWWDGIAPDATTPTQLASNVDGPVNGYWSEMSTNRVGFQTIDARPWTKVGVPCTGDPYAFFDAVASQVGFTDAPGRHLLVYFPRTPGCASGLGSVGSGPSDGGLAWVNGVNRLDVVAHEVGHNLGLGHSNVAECTDGANQPVAESGSCLVASYQDTYDVMGVSWGYAGHLNGAHSDALGWLTSSDEATVTGPGTFTLAPMAADSGLRVLRIPDGDRTYYVENRQPVGWDTWVTDPAASLSFGPGVSIRRTFPADGAAGGSQLLYTGLGSNHVAVLPMNGSFVVASSNLVVTLTGMSGNSATIVVSDNSPLSAFVRRAYLDFLGRAADQTGLAYWVDLLDRGVITREGLAWQFANQREYVDRIVNRFYQDTLGRPADSSGLAYWSDQIRSGRLAVADVAALFYASGEYFAGKGGGTLDSWVSNLYTTILGRPADPDGQRYWVQTAAAQGRPAVAGSFYQSLESRRARVEALYTQLLGRAADPGGLSYWTGVIQTRGDLALAAFLAGSDEYLARAQRNS